MELIKFNNRIIGNGYPVYIIAELSANHQQDINVAIELIKKAKMCGADAVKIQTYTPDTMTIDCDNKNFRIGKGTVWEGKTLYNLYGEAYTPWEWHPKLKEIAESEGLDFFSTPFDSTAVEYLEKMDVPIYKVASFEIVDIPLLNKIGKTGKPVIMSTGMSTMKEIEEAVSTLIKSGCKDVVLLKCTSSYPADPSDMNLRTIPEMINKFDIPIGLSNHTLNIAVPVASVALGACVVETHFTLSRKEKSPDSSFSLEPKEFKEMVSSIRLTEKSLGKVNFDITEKEKVSRVFRRSLYVVKDIEKGENFTEDNVRSIRPGNGLHTRNFKMILSKKAACAVKRGTPLSWELVE